MSQESQLSGFILKHQPLGELDILLTIFSLEKGKLRAVVKSGKKIISKLLPQLQVGSFATLSLAGKSDLQQVISAQTHQAFLSDSSSSHTLALLTALDLCNRSTADMQVNEQIFFALRDFHGKLNKRQNPAPALLKFYSQLITASGWQPVLLQDFEEEIYFSTTDGKFLPKPNSANDIKIPASAYRLVVDNFLGRTIDQSAYNHADWLMALRIVNYFAGYCLGRQLVALDQFLQSES